MTTKNETESGCCGGGCNTGSTGYWQDVEKKTLDPAVLKAEFQEGEFDTMSVEKSRRNFLKIMGFSVSALPLASCIKIPVQKALPFAKKNDTIVPGVANWFATSFNGEPVLVKTREGRPIKVEGNDKSRYFKGATNTMSQGSVLDLYDSNRLRSAMVSGQNVSWAKFDEELKSKLASVKGQEIVLVTKSFNSPSTTKLINEFKSHHGKVTHIAYDAVSNAAQANANAKTFGKAAKSEYKFDAADLIVSFDADFLGEWGQSTVNTKQWSTRRTPGKDMSRHIQVETRMTLTGTNCDERHVKTSAEQKNVLVGLLATLAGENTSKVTAENKSLVVQLAKELKAKKGKSLVVCGHTDVDSQVVVNKINDLLSNYGKTVNVYSSNYASYANDEAFEKFAQETASGSRKVAAVIFWDVNPVYNYYNNAVMTKALGNIPTKVALTTSANETSSLCNFVAPNNHEFETWNDEIVAHDEISVTQPVIQALYGSRMGAETLLATMGNTSTFHAYMKSAWKGFVTKQNKYATLGGLWTNSLHDGVAQLSGLTKNIYRSIGSVAASSKALSSAANSSELSVVTYVKGAIGNGDMANNPWLQECPDGVTKATWGNYVQVNPEFAKAKSLKTGDVVSLKSGTSTIELPVLVQAGLHGNTVSVALGYGRKVAGRVGKDLGANAFGFVSFKNGTFQYGDQSAALTKTGKYEAVALTQTHHSMEGRDIVRETTNSEYLANPASGNKAKMKLITMWDKKEWNGHKWGMVVDLNKCTGCSSCIVSCNAENNVSVVGKQEVINRREMHWLRIDRYYAGDQNNPEVVHQPMNCQHCDNAPCETVCPVIATSQSSDGLNQQTYNRCIGTRYCANNCPYKVRRFNWFDYHKQDQALDDSQRMVLNPDVVVRTRGVMEKCSMCVQRIQAGKLVAKKEGRPLADGEIKLACQQSCASDAIVFGDMNNPQSRIAKLLEHQRNYTVLEELNVKPAVSYLTKVRNN
jgi:molybdopterin-containing oxidoreductase family iron-sulfur binding subunit